MEDRGRKAELAIQRSGLTKSAVAERLHMDRRTLYNKLKRADLEYDFIIELYSILKLDVTDDFPKLGKFVASPLEVNEPAFMYQSKLDDCLGEVDKWKTKYIELMEEYNHLLKENRALQARQTG